MDGSTPTLHSNFNGFYINMAATNLFFSTQIKNIKELKPKFIKAWHYKNVNYEIFWQRSHKL